MNKGFTLIEILVVLAIMIIIASVVIFNVGSERQNSALSRSSQNLSLDLRRAQSFALSSKIYNKNPDGSACIPSDAVTCVPCGWGVHFNGIGSTSYIIFADLASSANCSDRDFKRAINGSEDFETVYFESGIAVNSLSGGLSDVVFTPPEPTIVFTPDQTTASVTLVNKNFSTRTININKFGFISSP